MRYGTRTQKRDISAAQKLAQDQMREAIPAIVAALFNETVQGTQVNIAFALAQLGDKTGFESLNSTCHRANDEAGLRMRAAAYLLDLHNESCLDAVIDVAQSDFDFSSRTVAISLLPQFRQVSEDDSQRIRNVVEEALLDKTAAVRLNASNALATLGTASTIPYLERAVTSEKDATVRSQMELDLRRLRENAARKRRF